MLVEIRPSSFLVENWQKGEIDGFFAYLKAETTLTYFGGFSPKSDFLFGDPQDKDFDKFYQLYDIETNLMLKDSKAKKLADHILSRKTFKPMFHQKTYLVYSKKYAKIGTHFSSPALTPFSIFFK